MQKEMNARVAVMNTGDLGGGNGYKFRKSKSGRKINDSSTIWCMVDVHTILRY
jgi:hypothetical protein